MKKIITKMIIAISLSAMVFGFMPTPVYATGDKPATQANPLENKSSSPSGLKCAVLPQFLCDASDESNLETSGTWLLLLFILRILTALIGVIAVAMFAWAGYMYATAGGDTGLVKQSKELMTNTAIGLILYLFVFSLLQFLVPGGIFN